MVCLIATGNLHFDLHRIKEQHRCRSTRLGHADSSWTSCLVSRRLGWLPSFPFFSTHTSIHPMADYRRMLAHTPQDNHTIITDSGFSLSHRFRHSITNATSFDDLNLEDIVDPYMLSPRIPYPACAGASPASASQTSRRSPPDKPSLHIRSRSLGSVLAPWPTSPPQSPLPPVPSTPSIDCRPNPEGHKVRSANDTSSLLTITATTRDRRHLAGTSPASFLSVTSSTDSQSSVQSAEDDSSALFHTAPVSPASLTCSDSHVAPPEAKTPRPRPYRHVRQSSSTSTIRTRIVNPLFRRGQSQDLDGFSAFSDSDEDSDQLATPTDTLPRTRHKRTSSWFKIIDRLKYNSDARQ